MIRFHHLREVPVAGLNQLFRIYRPFATARGIGVVVLGHEFAVYLA